MAKARHVQEQKVLALAARLNDYFEQHSTNFIIECFEQGYNAMQIFRRDVRRIVIETLNLTDTHTINSWLDLLISKGFLRPYRTESLKTDNDTVYYIEATRIKAKLNESSKQLNLFEKNDPHTQPQTEPVSSNLPCGVLVQKEKTVSLSSS